jgi:hypothetical protein
MTVNVNFPTCITSPSLSFLSDFTSAVEAVSWISIGAMLLFDESFQNVVRVPMRVDYVLDRQPVLVVVVQYLFAFPVCFQSRVRLLPIVWFSSQLTRNSLLITTQHGNVSRSSV